MTTLQHRHTTLVLLFASLIAAGAFAQTLRPGAMNPPHLREMPTVAQVLEAITAATPRDAAARRMGAFEQLNEIVEELSSGRTAMGRETPDEKRIMQEYRDARYAVQQAQLRTPADDALIPELRRFDADPALRDEMVKRFFSPPLQATVTALGRELQARRAAMRRDNVAFGGVPRDSRAGNAGNAQAPTPPPRPATPLGPPDPSIAKARAAKVDTTVLGFQLGEPLSLPECGLLEIGATARTCVAQLANLALGVVRDLGGPATVPDAVIINIAAEDCPAWMSDCQVSASYTGGRLVGVVATPDGAKVEEQVSSALRAKYGRGYSATFRTIMPTNGSASFKVVDLDWELPGLKVEYKVVADTIFKGFLRVETEAEAKRRAAATPPPPKF